MFKDFYFLESLQISLSKKAWDKLSSEAQQAIISWEASNWVGGTLEKHIKANDSVAKEIKQVMKPILDSIKGDTVTLYRGATKEIMDEPRFLQSWTSSEKVAKHFAGLSSSQTKDIPLTYPTYTQKEIDDVVEKFNKTGYVKFDNQYFIVDKKNPKYYNIYDKERNLVTDSETSEFRNNITSSYDERIDLNNKRTKDKVVLKRTFDKNKIIWISNNLDSKEYIVKVDE